MQRCCSVTNLECPFAIVVAVDVKHGFIRSRILVSLLKPLRICIFGRIRVSCFYIVVVGDRERVCDGEGFAVLVGGDRARVARYGDFPFILDAIGSPVIRGYRF